MYKRKRELGILDNKKMLIQDIHGILIDNFRLIENQRFMLGKNITIVSGRNGTMKSTVMGLLAQPFRTKSKDVFDRKMQTKFSEVFNLSTQTDIEKYNYHIKLELEDGVLVKEPIPVFLDSKGERHRLVPSGNEKGDGFFLLPSVYINLKRLFPLVEMSEAVSKTIKYTQKEKQTIAKLFENVLLKEEFSNFETYDVKSGLVHKNPIGPKGALYDISSISSGEDNLGTLANILISFQRIYDENQSNNVECLTGILSIDEFEASLHPVSQYNLLLYLLNWSQDYKVKIVINTHSLFLIEKIMREEKYFNNNKIKLNFITNRDQKDNKLIIIENPSYELALEELTLSSDKQNPKLTKIKVLCEDDEAIKYIKDIVGRNIWKHCNFISSVHANNEGTGYNLLTNLAKNYPKFLEDNSTMVVVDADVADDLISNTKNKYCIKIPSITSDPLPLEKELVNFILMLENDDEFFKKFKITRDIFRNQFTTCKINLNPENINDEKTKPYKNWFKYIGKTKVNSYRKYMVRTNKEKYAEFHKEFLNNINNLLDDLGLPNVEV